jgi:DnaJ family protein A protein 2
MIQRFQTVCPDCNGEGEIIKEKDKCKQCNGKKTTVDRKVLHVHVDKGVRSGTKVEFRGEGDQAPGVQAGDVVFEIEQKPHARFTRREDDLLYNCDIELVTALAGGTIYIEHLDDRWLAIEILPGEAIAQGMYSRRNSDKLMLTVPDAVKMVRGQGMPSPRHHDFGNMYIKFNVKFPEKNWTEDPEVFETLRKVLPAPAVENIPPADAMSEPASLEDLDNSASSRVFGNADGMMDDEDEDHPGGERVQCASQ